MNRDGGVVSKYGDRQIDAFSFLKAVPLIALPFVNLMEPVDEAGLYNVELDVFASVVDVTFQFGPATFLLCMGYGFAAGRSSFKRFFRQGVQFLMIGFILNIFRYFIPGVIRLIAGLPYEVRPFEELLISDIYYFVGLYFIFLALMKKLKLSSADMVIVSIGMLSVDNLIFLFFENRISNPYIAGLIGNFATVNDYSYFPLLSWAVFPSIGVLLGDVLRKRSGRDRILFLRSGAVFSSIFLISLIVLLYSYGLDVVGIINSPDYYNMNLLWVLLLLSAVFIMLCLVSELCIRICDTKFYGYVMRFSASIMPFYLLHWIVLEYEVLLLQLFGMKEGEFGIVWHVSSTLVVTAGCVFLSTKYGMKIMKPLLKMTSFWYKKR